MGDDVARPPTMHMFENIIDRQVVPACERAPGLLNSGGAVNQDTVVVEQQAGGPDQLSVAHTNQILQATDRNSGRSRRSREPVRTQSAARYRRRTATRALRMDFS